MTGCRWTREQYAAYLGEAGAAGKAAKDSEAARLAAGKRRRQSKRPGVLAGADLYLWQVVNCGLPEPETEFRFHPVRKWRSDFAWPSKKLIAEYEGGIHVQGRHTRGKGFRDDCEKYNAALLMGYRVLRFTDCMVESGLALQVTEQALKL